MNYLLVCLAFLLVVISYEKNFLTQAMEEVDNEIEEGVEARIILYKV
jgi:hypothetical protein